MFPAPHSIAAKSVSDLPCQGKYEVVRRWAAALKELALCQLEREQECPRWWGCWARRIRQRCQGVMCSLSLSFSFNFVCSVCTWIAEARAVGFPEVEDSGSYELTDVVAGGWTLFPWRTVHTFYAGPLQPHAPSMCSLIQILSFWLLDLIWASKIPKISNTSARKVQLILNFHLSPVCLVANSMGGALEVKGQPKVSVLMRHPLVFCDLSH